MPTTSTDPSTHPSTHPSTAARSTAGPGRFRNTLAALHAADSTPPEEWAGSPVPDERELTPAEFFVAVRTAIAERELALTNYAYVEVLQRRADEFDREAERASATADAVFDAAERKIEALGFADAREAEDLLALAQQIDASADDPNRGD